MTYVEVRTQSGKGHVAELVSCAGMIVRSALEGTCPLIHWQKAAGAVLLDVRETLELAFEHVPGALNIPLGQLHARPGELPKHRDIHVICRSGQRAHYAVRMLRQHGFEARHLAGGIRTRVIVRFAL